MRIVITGGAGFVGSNLARLYREKYPQAQIVAFDNLKRRGSELNLTGFKALDIKFHHGDIRNINDLLSLSGKFDLMVEASAEPSVFAGLSESPMYALETNLFGTVNALEYARNNVGVFIFLSTSRVYSIPELKKIPLHEGEVRFQRDKGVEMIGLTQLGISEEFSTKGFRSIYGSSKLGSELLIQEYAHTYKMKVIINRCGVIAGSGQFGKIDQGVFTYWVARHHFKKPLQYTGFGGKGLQVRDLLHPSDLFELIEKQVSKVEKYKAEIFNVGGGDEISTSLLELTELCEEVTQNRVDITSSADTVEVDVPYYVSDYTKARFAFDWKPKVTVKQIVSGIHHWICKYEEELKSIFNAEK